MKKFTFLLGLATGFVLGSRTGRGPYEQLESAVRQAVNQPKVQETLQSVADSAESVRDATLDATTDAIDDASRAATRTIDETSKRIKNGSQGVASRAGNGA
jgi:RNA polymerase-binding transcription factor DksA